MDGPALIALGLLILLLVPIVAADLGHRRIPAGWTLALGVVGAGYAIAREPSLAAALWILIELALVFAVLALAVCGMGRAGRPLRFGGGDAKFLLAACPWVGLEGAAAVLVLAGLILGGVAVFDRLVAHKADWAAPRPFAPMLSAALVLVMVALEFSRG